MLQTTEGLSACSWRPNAPVNGAMFVLMAVLSAHSIHAGEISLARVNRTTDIKLEPSPDAEPLTQAKTDDRYPLLATGEGWFQIQLFHATYYLLENDATEVIEIPQVPGTEDQRKAIFSQLFRAEAEAVKAADRQLKAETQTRSDLGEGLRIAMIERAKIDVCRTTGLSMAACIAIAFEGADKGWSLN